MRGGICGRGGCETHTSRRAEPELVADVERAVYPPRHSRAEEHEERRKGTTLAQTRGTTRPSRRFSVSAFDDGEGEGANCTCADGDLVVRRARPKRPGARRQARAARFSGRRGL